jgi:hypothetical protein
VSYAYYCPNELSWQPKYVQCASNLLFFLDKVLPLDPQVELVVSIIGSSVWPLGTAEIPGLRVRYAKQLGVDVFTHWEVLMDAATDYNSWDSFSHFVFLNCGTRGPYLLPNCQDSVVVPWLSPFVHRMQSLDASIVGSSFSCQEAPHVQSHFMLVASELVRTVILAQWEPRFIEEKDAMAASHKGISFDVVREVEVGLSEKAVRRGTVIADLIVSHSANHSACATVMAEGPKRRPTANNPSIYAQNPFDRVFIKHGGALVANYEERARTINGRTGKSPVFDTCKRTMLEVSESYLALGCAAPNAGHWEGTDHLMTFVSKLQGLQDKTIMGLCCQNVCNSEPRDASPFMRKSGLRVIITGREHSGTTMLSTFVQSAPCLFGAFETGFLVKPSPQEFAAFNKTGLKNGRHAYTVPSPPPPPLFCHLPLSCTRAVANHAIPCPCSGRCMIAPPPHHHAVATAIAASFVRFLWNGSRS